MSKPNREYGFCTGETECLSKADDRRVYRIANESGEAVMTCYSVFPGIELIYHDVHTSQCVLAHRSCGKRMEIHYCKEGRIEEEAQDAFFYLTPGDLSISQKKETGYPSIFPVGHYHGVTVVIDLERAPKCLSCFLEDVKVRPASVLEKFCKGNTCFVTRSNPHIEHIFSELYAVPDSIKKGYYKVKILELLLFLSSIELDENETCKRCLPRKQVDLVKAVSRHLSENMDSRITIAQLAEQFHISQTALKTSFKVVYGVSIYAYIRVQKMHAAAALLRRTECSVLEIAGQCGYDNASKFAGAFRAVVGLAPMEYRALEREKQDCDVR